MSVSSSDLFREAVTSSAFNLQLSRNMIAFLGAIYSGSLLLEGEAYMKMHKKLIAAMDGRNNWFPAGQALKRRGLVRHNQEDGYTLTEAGAHVVELLRIAGLIDSWMELKEAG